MFYTELIADSGHDEVDHVFDTAWLGIERGHRRQDDSPRLDDRRQIPQLNQSQWRFSWNHNELSPFLQVNVGSAMNEILRNSVRDSGNSTHAARANHHAGGEERSRGDARLEIAIMVIVELA